MNKIIKIYDNGNIKIDILFTLGYTTSGAGWDLTSTCRSMVDFIFQSYFISIPTSAPLSHSGAHSRGLGMEMEGSIESKTG